MPDESPNYEELVQKALYHLEKMKGDSCFDYGLIKRILEGRPI